MTGRPNAARTTALVAGMGLALGSAYPLAAAAIEVTRGFEATGFIDAPLVGLASAAVLAVAFGVGAFGVGGEQGVVGTALLGRSALTVFGLHWLVLELSRMLPTAVLQPGAAVEGYLSLLVRLVAVVAGSIAAAIMVRERVLGRYGRWALLPICALSLAGILASLTPSEVAADLTTPITAVVALALFVTGVCWATAGRRPASY